MLVRCPEIGEPITTEVLFKHFSEYVPLLVEDHRQRLPKLSEYDEEDLLQDCYVSLLELFNYLCSTSSVIKSISIRRLSILVTDAVHTRLIQFSISHKRQKNLERNFNFEEYSSRVQEMIYYTYLREYLLQSYSYSTNPITYLEEVEAFSKMLPSKYMAHVMGLFSRYYDRSELPKVRKIRNTFEKAAMY